MNKFVWVFAGVVIAAPVIALGAQPVWPAGAQEKSDSRVLAFYDGQCAQYADQNGLSGDKRQAFLEKCRNSISGVFPVGYARGGGGGDE